MWHDKNIQHYKSNIYNLAKKSKWNKKLESLATKTELKAEQDKIVKLQIYDLSYFFGKKCFGDDGFHSMFNPWTQTKMPFHFHDKLKNKIENTILIFAFNTNKGNGNTINCRFLYVLSIFTLDFNFFHSFFIFTKKPKMKYSAFLRFSYAKEKWRTNYN